MGELGVAVIVEDDLDVRGLLEAVLVQSGFEVHTAVCGREGVDRVREIGPDVVTLDVGLPDIDGFEVLRRIRKFSTAYIVMLTGREDEADVLAALQGGADDYITKPFRPREVRARITAMMRRPRHGSEAAAAGTSGTVPPASGESRSSGSILRCNGLELDYRRRTASLHGRALELTRSEFELLHEVIRGAGAVLSRTGLVRAVRAGQDSDDTYVSDADERAVEVHIGNIRRKLRDDQESPRWLETVRGVGYRLPRPKTSPPHRRG
ncbi:response regulator transcription factor [Pseudarthrobacter sp. NPDC080039]|uniref:response regulator transcription factor n=1 Tax=unclassified Pseudarthrobacter TaxID=2647000 RepID=UPI00344D27FC